jgi:hypothetical protein
MLTKLTTRKYRIVAALYLFLVYAFGVFSKTAWSDDYSSILDPGAVALHCIRDGRLIAGWSVDFLFSHFNSIQLLVFIRLIGLVGLILLNDLLLKKFLGARSSIAVVVASTVAFTLPSFQFSAHWAGAFGFSWTAYIAVLGFTLFKENSGFKKFVGFLVFVVSLFIYPLMSFFIFPYIYALWLIQGVSLKVLFREFMVAALLFVTGAVISFTLTALYLNVMGLTFNARVGLVTIGDIPSKIVFFFTRPFALTYRPFLIDSPTPWNLLFTLFIFSGLLIFLFWQKWRVFSTILTHLFAINLFFIAGLLPLLVTSDNQIEMRFVIVFMFLRLQTTSGSRFQFFKTKSQVITVVLVLLVGFSTVNQNFWRLYHEPFQYKQAFFQSQFSSCSERQIESGVVILQRTLPWPRKDLIGAYSQFTDLESGWVPVSAVIQYMKDSKIKMQGRPTLVEVNPNPNACLISLDKY